MSGWGLDNGVDTFAHFSPVTNSDQILNSFFIDSSSYTCQRNSIAVHDYNTASLDTAGYLAELQVACITSSETDNFITVFDVKGSASPRSIHLGDLTCKKLYYDERLGIQTNAIFVICGSSLSKYDISTGKLVSTTKLPCLDEKLTFVKDSIFCSTSSGLSIVDLHEGSDLTSAEYNHPLKYGSGARLGWHACDGALVSYLPVEASATETCPHNSMSWSATSVGNYLYTDAFMISSLANSLAYTCEQDYGPICSAVTNLPPYICSQTSYPGLVDSLSQGFANSQVAYIVLVTIISVLLTDTQGWLRPAKDDDNDMICGLDEDKGGFLARLMKSSAHLPAEFFYLKREPKAKDWYMIVVSTIVFIVTTAAFVAMFVYTSATPILNSSLSGTDLGVSDSSYACTSLTNKGNTQLFACTQSIYPTVLSVIGQSLANGQVVMAVFIMLFALQMDLFMPEYLKREEKVTAPNSNHNAGDNGGEVELGYSNIPVCEVIAPDVVPHFDNAIVPADNSRTEF